MSEVPDSSFDWDAMMKQTEIEMGIHHVDGVPWHDAPLPRRFHRCKAQTIKEPTLQDPVRIERCACGAIRMGNNWPGSWFRRNESRKSRRRGGKPWFPPLPGKDPL